MSSSYGEAFGHDEQLGAGGPGQRDGPALLPQVLADRDRDVDSVQPHHGQVAARDEDPELVEDAVVRQVVLGVAGHRPAGEQQRRAVLRLTLGDADPRLVGHVALGGVHPVEVADDDGELPETGVVQLDGEPLAGPSGRPRRTTSAAPGPRPGSR